MIYRRRYERLSSIAGQRTRSRMRRRSQLLTQRHCARQRGAQSKPPEENSLVEKPIDKQSTKPSTITQIVLNEWYPLPAPFFLSTKPYHDQIDVIFVELSLGRLRPQAKTFAEMLDYLRHLGFEYFDVAGSWRQPDTVSSSSETRFSREDHCPNSVVKKRKNGCILNVSERIRLKYPDL